MEPTDLFGPAAASYIPILTEVLDDEGPESVDLPITDQDQQDRRGRHQPEGSGEERPDRVARGHERP